MPTLTTPTPEALDALLSPGRNPLTVPCFGCGDDYLSRPANLAVLRPAAAAAPAAFYTGCECEPCAQHFTALTPVVTSDDEVTYDTPDTTGVMTCLEVLYREGRSETRVVHVLCRGCRDAATVAMNRRETCDWCGTGCDTTGLDIRQRQVPTFLTGHAWGIPVAADSRGEGMTQPSNGVWQNTTPSIRRATLLGEALVCTSCVLEAAECADCGTETNRNATARCPQHDGLFCNRCYRGGHRRCNDDVSVDIARRDFSPRLSINQALRSNGEAGTTIISTRAVGMEVETSRGVIRRVLDAENAGDLAIIASVGTDGSVNGDHAVEYRLLPRRGVALEQAIVQMHTRCADAGYQPDQSAGVHMHLDCSDLTSRQVWQAFAGLLVVEDLLFALADSRRRGNSYCRPYAEARAEVLGRVVTQVEAGSEYVDIYAVGSGYTRYQGVNLQAYENHSTIELRMFDCDHSEAGRTRYLHAAALGTAVVDFAATEAGATWFAGGVSVGDPAAFLAMLVAQGHLAEASAGHIRQVAGLGEQMAVAV